MTFELCVYQDYSKFHKIDLLEEIPETMFNNHVYGRVNDSVVFDKITDITYIVKHLLLNTKFYFEIKKIHEEPRGYFVK